MTRTDEQRDYHAKKERDAALARLGESAAFLMRNHNYTPGQLLDVILGVQ